MAPVAESNAVPVPPNGSVISSPAPNLRKQVPTSNITVSAEDVPALAETPAASDRWQTASEPAKVDSRSTVAPKNQQRRLKGLKLERKRAGREADTDVESTTGVTSVSEPPTSLSASVSSIDAKRQPARVSTPTSESEPKTLSDPIEYQDWSKLADEELSIRPLATSVAPSDVPFPTAPVRGGRGGRGGGRGGRGGFSGPPPPPHASAAMAYRERLEKDPSFIPRVGQFWGHDERLLDQDLRGLSGWWRGRGRGRGRGGPGMGMHTGRGRGRGGIAYAGDVATRGGRGGFRGGAVQQFGGRGAFFANRPPAPRRSKMAGWDDDESDIDDDALHGKSVRKVPTSAQPQQILQAPQTTTQQQRVAPKLDMTGVPTAPRAIREAQAQWQLRSDALEASKQEQGDAPGQQQQGWEQGGTAEDAKVSAWKATLADAQISPSLPAQRPDSTVQLSSSSDATNGAPMIDAHSSSSAKAAGSDVSPTGTSASGPSEAASSKAATAMPSTGLVKTEAYGSGMWAHDGFEAMQHMDPRGSNVRGGRGGARGGHGRGRGFGGYHPKVPYGHGNPRGRAGVAMRGRGAAFAARGGRGGFHHPALPAAVDARPTDPPSGDPRADGEKLAAGVIDLSLVEDATDTKSAVRVNLPKVAKEPEGSPSKEPTKPAAAAPSHLPPRPTFDSLPAEDSLPPSTSQSMSASSSATQASMYGYAPHAGQPPAFYPYMPPGPGPMPPTPPPMMAGYYPPTGQLFQGIPQGCAVDVNGTVLDLSSGQPVPVGFYAPHMFGPPPPLPATSHPSVTGPMTGTPGPSSAVMAGRPAYQPKGIESGDFSTATQRTNRAKGAIRPSSVSIPASAAKVEPFRPGAASNGATVSAQPQESPVSNAQYYGGQDSAVQAATGATYYQPYGYAPPGYGMVHPSVPGAPMYPTNYAPIAYGMGPAPSGGEGHGQRPPMESGHYAQTPSGHGYGPPMPPYEGSDGYYGQAGGGVQVAEGGAGGYAG